MILYEAYLPFFTFIYIGKRYIKKIILKQSLSNQYVIGLFFIFLSWFLYKIQFQKILV